MKTSRKLLLIAEVIFCFSPVALLLFTATIASPIWMVMLGEALTDGTNSSRDEPMVLLTLVPLLSVASGIAGMATLFYVVPSIVSGATDTRHIASIRLGCVLGVFAVAQQFVFPILVSTDPATEVAAQLFLSVYAVFLFWLPLLCTFHLAHLHRLLRV